VQNALLTAGQIIVRSNQARNGGGVSFMCDTNNLADRMGYNCPEDTVTGTKRTTRGSPDLCSNTCYRRRIGQSQMLKFKKEGQCTSFRSVSCQKDEDCLKSPLWNDHIHQECGMKALSVHKCNSETILSYDDIINLRKEDSVKSSAHSDVMYREVAELFLPSGPSIEPVPDIWNVAVCQKETKDSGTNASVVITDNEATTCGGNVYASVMPTSPNVEGPTKKAWLILEQIEISKGQALNGGGLCLRNNINEISARLRGVTVFENVARESGGGVWHEGLVLALSGTDKKMGISKLSTSIGSMSVSDASYCEARQRDAANNEIPFSESCAKGLIGGKTSIIRGNIAGKDGGGIYVVSAPISSNINGEKTQRAVLQLVINTVVKIGQC